MMRLEKIKLAGFKSFVDPTVLELRSSLVSVVGPNGCGKSNIIDAVRWVMGESSAKNLRGESLTDVIFNGSTTRKPVGQASVELIFDNSDGSLGGEYARFSEISVRRQATRDGQSTYYLNGTRCRRKDITDVFLGTGLGPRSYSIIEQGMISRVIEAKPEELRAFLEEAAGISLYYKRRQETEVRIRHTRENLERLNDVMQELEKQLERLKRQSEAAEKYRLYKTEYDKLEAELCGLRWRVFHEQLQEKASSIRHFMVQLEEKQAIRTSLDLDLEMHRLTYTEKTDVWKTEQGQYYDLKTQIARIEQSLQHHREREQRLEQDLTETQQHYQKFDLQIEQDKSRLIALQDELAKLLPESEASQAALKQSEEVVAKAEAAMQNWLQEFEVFQTNAEKPQRVAEFEKAKILQLERQSREAKLQVDRLTVERDGIDIAAIEQQLAVLDKQLLETDKETHSLVSEVNELSSHLTKERDLLTEQNNDLDKLRGQLQSLKGRLASLEALQQAALGKTDSAVQGWLKNHGLSEYPRLGEIVTVEKGFEYAVETVLGNALEALCIPGMATVAHLIEALKEGNLTFIDETLNTPISNTADLLINKVKSRLSVEGLLAGIYVVDGLDQALQKQKTLKNGESVITRNGIWLGPNWLKIYRGSEGHGGILARETEIKEIQLEITRLQQLINNVEQALLEQKEKIQMLENKRETLHQSQRDRGRFLNELSAKVSAERAHLEHSENRLTRLEVEIAEQIQKLDLADEETALARLNLQKALDEVEDYTKRKTAIQEERDTLQDLLRKANQDLSTAKETAHTLAMREGTMVAQKQAVEEGIQRLLQQQQAVIERTNVLQAQLKELKAPEQTMRQNLEELLEKQMAAEEHLHQAKIQLEEIEEKLRSLEKRRTIVDDEIQDVRSELEQLRVDSQAIEVRSQTVQEKLVEMGKTVEEVIQSLTSDLTESLLTQELEQLSKKIERLGAINLAAIEEYQSELERKNYLDSQHKDLTEALETLENAIRKIDRETRTRFKETFDKVNAEFQRLFPRLFGGGQAYLELSGEDLLNAGVSVMARPPGKRNASIHLLSGGEKALTAVAMVFAIFQLNPAPFCLLDEVDAPLDDANVGRYCELVKQLSNTVQFIFITHNKLAMEMAHHLVGVTMKEPGVSRLVSVDVEEAAALAVS